MAKKTLLEIVQDVLNDTDGDFVNSIDDTDEAGQIAAIAASTYQAMLSNRNWPHTNRVLQLEPFSDSEFPTYFTINENLKELISVYYDKQTNDNTAIQYREVKWKEPDDFLRYVFGRNSNADNVMTVTDYSGVKLLIMTDKAPEYYTSFDDNTIIFDSYDSEVDSTLQASKIVARGYIIPAFEVNDEHVPDLPDEAFAAFIEEVKSKAAYKVNQKEDIKSEQESARQQRWLSRKAWRAHGGIRYPNYGRRRGRYTDPTFRKD